MRKIMILTAAIGLMLAVQLNAQNKYFTREGRIVFLSKAPMEEIQGINKKVTSVLDITTGQMEFSVLMKAFEFEKALMKEHFNENYVESDKFPKATFKGNIENLQDVKWTSDGNYPVKVSGKMTIHGVTKDFSSGGTIEVKAGKILATSSFQILIKDYNIEIPKLVKDNIAESVKVDVNLDYELFTAKQ